MKGLGEAEVPLGRTAIIQARDTDGFYQASSRDLKWMTSESISERDPADFNDGLNIGCERNRATELILSFCPKQLERWSYSEVRKAVGEVY